MLDTLRSLPGDGPIVAVPAFRRVLALAAHPDDEVVGCGGLLRALADAGAEVHVCFATDGRGDDRRRVRRRRGGRPPAPGRGRGGVPGPRQPCRPRSSATPTGRSRSTPTRWRPTWPGWSGAAARRSCWRRGSSTATATTGPSSPPSPPAWRSWGYETWTPLTPNRIVDVSAKFARKEEALACYATAHLAFDVGAMLALNRYRSVHGLSGRGHAEAYLARPA